MENRGKKIIIRGCILLAVFCLWTALIKIIDVQPAGQNSTDIGFAGLNLWFHRLTGVHLGLYNATDVLSLVPLLVCVFFGAIGLIQLIKRKSLSKVDRDIVILGCYYIAVIAFFFLFEKFPVNYRPILIEGALEASYPSSTTLLVLSVMPTLAEQFRRRAPQGRFTGVLTIATAVFTAFMVISRLVSGVHWITDIAGGVFLSAGLFFIYKGLVILSAKK